MLAPSGLAGQLARHTECVERTDDTIKLRLDRHAASLNTAEICVQLEQALRDGLHNPKLSLTVETGEIATQTIAAATEQAAVDAQSAAEQSIADDPVVQDILRTFDGRVRPNSIKPLE